MYSCCRVQLFDHRSCGHYTGHHTPGPNATVSIASDAASNPILTGVDLVSLLGRGSLYKVSPLAKSATPLLIGTIPGQAAEPIAWTNLTSSGGRVFYTSLGHADDFAEPSFQRLLRNAIDWAVGRDVPAKVEVSSTAPIQFPGSK